LQNGEKDKSLENWIWDKAQRAILTRIGIKKEFIGYSEKQAEKQGLPRLNLYTGNRMSEA
jgi:hypothetical protein